MASDMDAIRARLLEWAGSRQVRLTLPAVASWVRALLAENERLEKWKREHRCSTETIDVVLGDAY